MRERSSDTWIFWIHAGSMARVEQGFRDIADHAGIPERDNPCVNIFKLVYDWLSSSRSGKWLLILDNVDNASALGEAASDMQGRQEANADSATQQSILLYLPESQNGAMLFTSRSKTVALKLVEERDIITVEAMGASSAKALFEKKLGALSDSDDIIELATLLDFMPLAVVQAATYISQRTPRCSVRTYLKDFRRSDHKKLSLLAHEGGQLRRGSQAENSILKTWQISFEHIRQISPSAADLLSLMSFFDRHSIPEGLVRKPAANGFSNKSLQDLGEQNGNAQQPQRDEMEGKEGEERALGEHFQKDSSPKESESSEDDEFENDLQILRNYSFISFGTNRTFEMHALVQLATRRWLEARGQLKPWRESFITILYRKFPDGSFRTWTKCQALFPHVRAAVTQQPGEGEGVSSTEWATLLCNAAVYAWRRGNLSEATSLSEKAMKVLIKTLGQENEKTLECMEVVGITKLGRGLWNEAEEMMIQVRDGRSKVLGEHHADTVTGIANLAALYKQKGHLKEAEELNRETLEIRRTLLGTEHSETLISQSNLASTCMSQGRWKEAEELQIRTLEARIRLHGEDHPETLTSLTILATTYQWERRWKEAEQLHIRALAGRRRIFSEEHSDTLVSKSGLASIYRDQRRNKEAEELGTEVVRASQQTLGKENPQTLMFARDLGEILCSCGKYEQGEQLFRQTLSSMENVHGKEHLMTLTCANGLGVALDGQGRFGDAEETHRQTLALRQSVLGRSRASTLTSMNHLAEALKGQGRYQDAEGIYQQALTLSQVTFGKKHAFTLKIVVSLAFTLERQD